MRLEWLEDILAVAETGSLSEAAERRNLTQSAFSRRVKAIEDYVGVPLFDRSRKPVQMHPTTSDQHQRIAELATDLRQLVADLRQVSQASGNRVVFASQHALTTSLTPGLLRWVSDQAPDIYVRLRSANLDECFGLLLSRQVDLAFVYRERGTAHLVEADFIEDIVLGQDRLIPVFSTERARELNDRFVEGELQVVAYPPEVFLGKVMDDSILPRLRRATRVVPKVETALTLAALEMACVGIGVAWVPSSLAQDHLEAGTLADLSSSLPYSQLEVTAVRLAGLRGAAQSLVWQRLKSISNTPDRVINA